jgi:hypothetical protein
MVVSGVTEMTDRVMIWWARMGELRRFRQISMKKPIAGPAGSF